MKHEKFVPLSSPGGDGRNDIALLYIRTRGGRGISFDEFVSWLSDIRDGALEPLRELFSQAGHACTSQARRSTGAPPRL